MNQKRNTILFDKDVQFKIAGTVAFYWFASMFAVVVLVAMFNTWRISGSLLVENLLEVIQIHAFIILGMLIFLPLIILHAMRLPVRFAGPIHRLRKDLARLESGESVEFSFRSDDYWKDIPESLNSLVAKIEELEDQVAKEVDRDSVGIY